MSDKLKPCPFCGERQPLLGGQKVGFREWQDWIGVRQVSCEECGHQVSRSVWQFRPIEDALRAHSEKAERERDEAKEAICLIYERCEQYPITHEVEVQIGEVTSDMATDAGEPGMEGMPVYGLCDETIPLTEYESVFSLPAVRRALERREEK